MVAYGTHAQVGVGGSWVGQGRKGTIPSSLQLVVDAEHELVVVEHKLVVELVVERGLVVQFVVERGLAVEREHYQ